MIVKWSIDLTTFWPLTLTKYFRTCPIRHHIHIRPPPPPLANSRSTNYPPFSH